MELSLKKKTNRITEDIGRISKKYMARESLGGLQYEIHYLLKLTCKLSESTLLRIRSGVKEIWRVSKN